MSLKLNHAPKHVPFFPPGIASHRVVSSNLSTKDFISKRPQTVKECKTLSKKKRNFDSMSPVDYYDHQSGLRRFSNSTPNLKTCHVTDRQTSSVPRHNCGITNVDRGYFKASPLPPYYSTESLERNRSLFGYSSTRDKTRSLSSSNVSKNLTGFVPERPFYPPSKYPSIHDACNSSVRRLVETRDKYKTPESRKLAHDLSRRLSMNNMEKKNRNTGNRIQKDNCSIKNSSNHRSVPNLDFKAKNEKNIKSNSNNASFGDFYSDQMAYTSEMGPYRRSGRLDLLNSDEFNRNSSNDMYTSYFYPKPIPSNRNSNANDRMAQSLIFERSVASMIFTGSLDRANRHDQYRQNEEITDLDDSPTKSISAPKRPNSFSQDSLDGNRIKNTHGQQKQGDTWRNSGSKRKGLEGEEPSGNSEHDKSTTMSQIEEDELKTLCSGHSGSNYFMEHLQCKDELDQYNIDQETKQYLTIKDLSSFQHSDGNTPLSIGNEFICSREHSIIGKDDKTLLNDLASKCIVSTNQTFSEKDSNMARPGNPARFDGYRNTQGNPDELEGYHQGHNRLSKHYNDRQIKESNYHNDKTFENSNVTVTETMRFHSTRRERDSTKNVVATDQFSDRIVITEDNLTCVTPLYRHTERTSSKCKDGPETTDNFNTDFSDYDGILAGDSCIIQGGIKYTNSYNDKGFPDNHFEPGLVKFNGFYKTDQLNQVKHIRCDEYGNPVIPDIEVEGDGDATDSSSTNELSWSGYEENKSYRDYGNNSVPNQRVDIPWASSPELHSARYSYTRRPDRRLQSENPLKPLCSYCHKPAYFMERISISNIIFHKSCFRCRKCDTHLNFNNCILHRNRPYCLVHVRPKIWKSVRSASANKLNQIKERLDNKSNIQRQGSTEVKQPKRIFYEGIKSAKTKFLEDATKAKEIQVRNPKRITPPRQGVNSGVIESEPKPRDPNVIPCRDYQSGYYDDVEILAKSTSAKDTRNHFKELQNKSYDAKQDSINGESRDLGLNRRPDVIPVDTKSLRNRFLEAANDSDSKLNKINPSDDIQRLSQLESNSIYENEPQSRSDVVRSNSPRDDETIGAISKNRAKEMKDKFSNFTQGDKPMKSQFKLEYGEGGVYESNPQENNDDVVKHNYDTTVNLPENTVKSGLQRIKELQDIKSQGFQKTNKEPIKFLTDPNQSGIYENTPEQSRADSLSGQNDGGLVDFREKNYANDAKRLFMERQKLETEASTNKSTPHMIDIWKDLCPDSGIFENEPKEQREDVVKCEYRMDELMVHSNDAGINGIEENRSLEEHVDNNIDN